MPDTTDLLKFLVHSPALGVCRILEILRVTIRDRLLRHVLGSSILFGFHGPPARVSVACSLAVELAHQALLTVMLYTF